MTQIIAISNEKGGVAKTTTTLSLGAALVENGNKVLLIDLDPQANLTLALGFEPSQIALSSGDLLLESVPLLSICQKSSIENLDLIPSNSKMDRAEQLLPIHLSYSSRLNDALEEAAPLPYDYVLLDCPPALGAVTRNAMDAATLVIIPTQAEYFSAYALRDMMSLIRTVREESNPNISYRVLITMLDRRNRAHNSIREQLRATFTNGLFETIIEVDTKLRESPILGLPILQYKPSSRGSQQYRVLAQELEEYVKETNR